MSTNLSTLSAVGGWRRDRTVDILTIAALVGLVYLAFANPYDKLWINRCLGLLLIVGAGYPAWRWARFPQSDPIPVLAMMGLFYVVCYGLAGLAANPHPVGGQRLVSELEYTRSLYAAIVSWASIWAGFALMNRHRRAPRKGALSRWGTGQLHLAYWPGYPLALVLSQVMRVWQVAEAHQALEALHLFFFCWVLHGAWSRALSRSRRRLVLGLALPVEILLRIGIFNGVLAGLLNLGQILGITYSVTKSRVPLLALLTLPALFFLLNPAKGQFRMETWQEGRSPTVGRYEGVARFFSLAWDAHFGENGSTFRDNFDYNYSRVNHLHTLTIVMGDTPGRVPFKQGETYTPLLTKWIPRAIWPDKPIESLGNHWAKDYGLLLSEDDSTSFNLPWLAEMFMNFGWLGVFLVSFAVGGTAGAIRTFFGGARNSAGFAAGLVVLSPFFFPESNLSMQFGGVLVSSLVLFMAVKLATIGSAKLQHQSGRHAVDSQ